MSLMGLTTGASVLITGIETDPGDPDLTRVYIGQRGAWNYVLCSGDDAEKVRREWGSTAHHLFMAKPESYYHDAAGNAAARATNEGDTDG